VVRTVVLAVVVVVVVGFRVVVKVVVVVAVVVVGALVVCAPLGNGALRESRSSSYSILLVGLSMDGSSVVSAFGAFSVLSEAL
jgi:hypothetical protein